MGVRESTSNRLEYQEHSNEMDLDLIRVDLLIEHFEVCPLHCPSSLLSIDYSSANGSSPLISSTPSDLHNERQGGMRRSRGRKAHRIGVKPRLVEYKRTRSGQSDRPIMDSESANKIKAYRVVGYAAVTFSAVAVLSIAVTLPMVYNYVHHMRRTTIHELQACKTHAKGVWSDVFAMKALPSHNRTARQAYWEDAQCNGCCLPGPAGPAGTPGRAGTPGHPGAPGQPGNPGRPPSTPCEPMTPPPCQPCPAGRPGAPGAPGPAGNDGRPGSPGPKGQDGHPGENGGRGNNGQPGRPGNDGRPGAPGKSAQSGRPIPGPPGQPGRPGSQGPQGPAGRPGNDGRPGQNGSRGQPGSSGAPGNDGQPGQPGRDGNSGGAGERGICPKYCALDGGIFFEDGTRR